MRLRAIAPMFLVRDLVAAAAYYTDVLGFTIDRMWNDPPSFAMPHRDKLVIMLLQRQDPSPPHGADGETWDAYVWVDDADALFSELEGRGARIVHAPVDRPYYGNREFAVRDLDDHIIAFAHTYAPPA